MLQHDDVSLEMRWCVENQNTSQHVNKNTTFREAIVFWSTRGWDRKFLPCSGSSMQLSSWNASLDPLSSKQQHGYSGVFTLLAMGPGHGRETSQDERENGLNLKVLSYYGWWKKSQTTTVWMYKILYQLVIRRISEPSTVVAIGSMMKSTKSKLQRGPHG